MKSSTHRKIGGKKIIWPWGTLNFHLALGEGGFSKMGFLKFSTFLGKKKI